MRFPAGTGDWRIAQGERTMYYIGLDIHIKNTQTCVTNENGKIISSAKFLSDVDHIGAFRPRNF